MASQELVLTFGGVILGFFLATLKEVFKERAEKRQEARNIREILAEEARYNKAVLKNIYELVTTERQKYEATLKPDGGGGFSVEGNPARVMGTFSPVRLTSEAWSSQLQKIPSALQDTQIAELLTFHRNLAEIQSLQSTYLSGLSSGSTWLHEPMMQILNLIEEVLAQRLSIENQ